MTIGAIAPELDAAFFRALLRDSDQPRCSDLETGKSGQYTNDDGAGCDGAGRKAGVGASETSPGTAAGDEQLGMAIHPPAEIRAKVNRALASFETVEQYDAKIETAFAVNPATGEVALKKVGTEREVRFTPDEARELAGTVFTHNHPATGGSFSAPDIAMFLAHEMVEMRAFGRGYDGKLYHYRVTRHGRPATQAWQEWVARGMEMSNELHSVWFPEVMSGKRTKEDAELNHNHKVWEDFFADKPGFEYERRVVGEGKRRSLRRATDESRDLAPGEQPDGGWILDGPGSEPDYSAPARARRSDQPRCSELEEGKPGRFTNADGDGCEGASANPVDEGAATGRGKLSIRYGNKATAAQKEAAEQAVAAALKNNKLTEDDIVDLFVPEGVEAKLSAPFGGGLSVWLKGDGFEAIRFIKRDLVEETLAIQNEALIFEPRAQGKGMGTAMLAREVRAAARLGVTEILLNAGRNAKAGYFGYKVWPRLGFDAPIADRYQPALTAATGKDWSGKNLSDLMADPDGREAWDAHGDSVVLTFDPRPGSKSRRLFDAYLRERAKRKAKRALLEAWLRGGDDQPRCSEIEEGKPGRFTNDDGEGCEGAEGKKGADAKADAPPATRFRTNVTPREFIDARNATTRPGFLSPLTEAELDGKTLVLSTDGKVGYMLAPDGYAGNLFNNGGPKGAGKAALVDAIERGASYLDCFDGFLPDLYHDYGFVETGRLKFVDEYAPTGWDFDRYGRPDVVFMAYRGGDRKTIKDRVGTFGEHRKPAELVDDYDEALDRAREVSRGADGAERRGVGREAQGAARRAGRVHRRPLTRDDQPRCSDLEEGKPGRYTNEDGAGCDGAVSAGDEALDRDDVAAATETHGRVQYELGMPKRLRDLGIKLRDVNALVPPGVEAEITDLYPDAVRPDPSFGLIMRGDGWFANRRVRLASEDHNGLWPAGIENDVLKIRDEAQRGGIATDLLRRQIEFANTYGINVIKAFAAKGPGTVGYKVWPALGFDAKLPKGLAGQIARRLPAAKGVKTLLDLYAVPGGREFWAEHGESLDVQFDPRAGSASRRVFDAYLEKRRARDAKRARVAAWLRSDQPRCSELEEGATGQYTNDAGDGCGGAEGKGDAAGKKDPVKDHAIKGKGKIAFVDEMGGTAEAADAMLKQFGITPDDIVDLFGPEGSEVTYGIDVATKDPEGRGGALWIKTTLDDGERKMEAWRRIDKPSRKELVLTNLDFHVEPRGSGFGTRFIAREVAAAERLGIKRIVIDTAAGGPNSTAYNGYYTWPLLGFDVPVKRLHTQLAFAELRERWPDAEYLSDIMKTPEGRKFWKEKGAGIFGMEFDVTPGSRSRRVLDAYLERKFGSDTKRAKVEAWLRSDQPRCSELEEGEPGRFTNEDGQGCEGAEGGGDTPMGGRKSKREPGDDSTTEYEAHKQGWRETTLADGTVVKTFIPDVDKLEPVEGEGKYTDRVQVDDAAARALKAERERLLAGDSDEQRAAAEKLAAEEQKLRELQEQFDEHQKRDMELYNELDDELRPAWQADQALADAIDTKLADGQEITPEEKAFRAAFEKDSLYSRIRAHERMAPLVEERSQWYNTLSDQRDAIRAAKQELVAADRQSLFLPEDERFDLVVSVADPAATAAGFRDPAAAMLWNDRLAEAKGFLSGVIHKDALTRTSDDATKPVAVSLKPENDFIPYRAYAFPGARNEVVLSADTNAAVMVHELGHLVESGLGSTSRFAPAVMEFLNSRLSDAERDAPFSKLISYHPDSAGYGMGVFRDHLDNLGMVVGGAPSDGWYAGSTHGMHLVDVAAGKLYPPKNFRELYETQKKSYFSVSNNTEVVSMGFEALFRNPRQFAKLDPDYFDFILGLARGYTKSAGRWGQPRKPSRKKRKPKK